MNPLHDRLNVNEREVIEGWCSGLSNEEIAEVRHIPRKAVDGLGNRLLPKLGARSPRHACAIWASSGGDYVPAGVLLALAEKIADEALKIARGLLK